MKHGWLPADQIVSQFHLCGMLDAGLWGYDAVVMVPSGISGEQYMVRHAGYVKVPADGAYTFHTHCDDAAQLFVGGEQVVSA